MSTYTLKSMARRGTLVLAAAALVVAAIVPSLAYADALNPLTERSLLLSSSAPGYQDTDGSGNSTSLPNAEGGSYAPPGSGPNGKKSGETFSFRVSTDSAADNRAIKAFTLQYCTTAAGKCRAPGNNSGDARQVYPATGLPNDPANADSSLWPARDPAGDRGADTASTSDLNVNYTTPVLGTDFDIYVDLNNDGDFLDANEQPTGWSMTTSNVEDLTHSNTLTGAKNFITLTSATGILPPANAKVQIVFNASETNYITNPGNGAFFVKMNTYDTDTTTLHIPTVPALNNPNIIDGGVTVANVMTDSIHITTKVLETMSFSVGTRNRDTVAINCGVNYGTPQQPEGCEAATSATHGTCSPIQQVNNNRLQLGNEDAEYSLETDTAYDVYSYWRLSSNSSGGATVYYSGNTLANTVGDEIAEIGGAPNVSTPGTEQFGLAFVDAGDDDFDAEFDAEVSGDPDRFKYPTLLLRGADIPNGIPTDIFLAPEAAYANGKGSIIPGELDVNDDPVDQAEFAFLKSSNLVPEVIAENNEMVISCATAKMRYIANIGADTPAGVYTTKINYLAAPQY